MHKETKVPQIQHTEDLLEEKMSISQVQPQILVSSSTSTHSTDGAEVPIVSSSISDTQFATNSLFKIEERSEDELQTSSEWLCETSPPPPPPGVDSPPPPPPPSSPPPHSPLPFPLDTTETICKLPEDMDLENSNDSCSQSVIPEDIAYEVNQIQYSSQNVCSFNNRENDLDDSVTTVTSTLQTSCDELNIISESSQNFSLTLNISVNKASAFPLESLSSKSLKDDVKNVKTIMTPVSSQSHSSLDFCQSSGSSTKSAEVKVKVTQATSGSALKKEKKKTKLLPVMALKKKNIPLLVEKWRKIREEQDKEDKLEHS